VTPLPSPRSPPPRAAARAWVAGGLLLLAFALSGFSTLVYEILWTRVVSATFGVTAHAIATILSAFMAGLALGSLLGGRYTARVARSPLGALGAYAAVEVLVAVAAVAVQAILVESGPLMRWISLTFPGTGAVALAVRFVCLAGLLLAPATLMGATLPLFTHGFVRLARHPHRGVTLAYGVNVLGAAAGCYAAAFVLLEGLGVGRSVWLAAGLNVAAALLALGGAVLARGVHAPESEPELPPTEQDFSSWLPLDGRVLYGLVAVTGLATLASEVVWSRVYRQAFHLMNPFKGFALVLAMILTGMAVGSLAVATRKPSARGALAVFGGLQLALAATALLGIAQVRLALLALLPDADTQRVVAGITLLVPAMLAGACFPTLGSVVARARAAVGARLGALSAASTAGGVLGSLVGGFVLLPVLGSRLSLLVLSTTAVACGWTALRHGVWREAPDGPAAQRVDGASFALVVAIGWVGFVTADVPDFRMPPAHTLLWMDDGLEATTVVLNDARERQNVLYTNAVSIEANAQAGRVAMPMVLAPTHRRVLLIGFGTGSSAKSLLDNLPDIRLDCVELDGNQIASAGYFGTERVLTDPRFQLVVDDGRQYFLRNPGTWDLIVVDTFGQDVNQEFYGAGFYEAAREALSEDGTFFVKLPVESMARTADIDVMLGTLADVFPYAYAALVHPKSAANGLVGRRTPLTLARDRYDALPLDFRRLLPFDDVARGLAPLDAAARARILGTRRNTDDQPWFFEHRGDPREQVVGWANLVERATGAPPR